MSASSKMMTGALPPSSRWTRFRLSAAARATFLPDSTEPGDRHHPDAGMRRDGRAHGVAVAGDDVEDALGQDVGGDLGHPQGGERRDLGRLQHHRVPGREGGRDLPRRHHQRVVPRRDLADDADRLAPDHRGRPAHVLGRGLALRRAGGPGHEAKAVGCAGHLFDGRAAGLADVQGLELAQLLGVLVERVGELVQDLEPLGRGGFAPVAEEGSLGRLDRVVDVLGGRIRDGGDHLAGRGIDHVDGLSRARIRGLSADVVRKSLQRNAHVLSSGWLTPQSYRPR